MVSYYLLHRIGRTLPLIRISRAHWFVLESTLSNMAAIIPPVTKLSERVIRILGCNPSPMTLQGTNTYLIGTGKKRILLDTGDANINEYIANVQKIIKEENVNISDIIVTHWHHDHIGGVANLYPNVVGNCNLWKHKRAVDDIDNDELPPNIKFNWLENKQQFNVDGASLTVHHTPGHTTDHVVLSMVEDNVLFSGDCILGEGTAVFEDLYNYMRSLGEMLKLKPNTIYPGHGNVINDPIQRIEYYISHRNERESQIMTVMHKDPNSPLNEMDIVKIIYIDTPEHLWSAAAYNVNHHLEKLTKENKLKKVEKNGETKWYINPHSPL